MAHNGSASSAWRTPQAAMRIAVFIVLLLGSAFVLVGVFGIGLHYVQVRAASSALPSQ
jgi:hypothetical protein